MLAKCHCFTNYRVLLPLDTSINITLSVHLSIHQICYRLCTEYQCRAGHADIIVCMVSVKLSQYDNLIFKMITR